MGRGRDGRGLGSEQRRKQRRLEQWQVADGSGLGEDAYAMGFMSARFAAAAAAAGMAAAVTLRGDPQSAQLTEWEEEEKLGWQ